MGRLLLILAAIVVVAGGGAYVVFTGPNSESVEDQGTPYASEWVIEAPGPMRPSRGAEPDVYNSTQRGRPVALAPLRVENAARRRLWATLEPICYQVRGDFADNRRMVRVYIPQGFRTDLASIPAAGRVVLNPADYAEAALVHDFLYALGIEGQRARADAWFLRALVSSGIQDRPARLMHRAVRFGGENGYGRRDEITSVWDFSSEKERGTNASTLEVPQRARNLGLTEEEILQQMVLCSIRRAYGLKEASGRRNRRLQSADSEFIADCFADMERFREVLAGTVEQLNEACPNSITLLDRPALARQLGLVGEAG